MPVSLGPFLKIYFVPLGYISLFLHVFYNFMLRSVFSKNQPHAPVFTDCLRTEEHPPQSAQLQILSASETFLGRVQLLWACVGRFSIRETCQFLFQEFVISCSPWCLSAVLQVLWSDNTKSRVACCCMPASHQHPKSSETDTNPSGSPLKSQNARHTFHLFPSHLKEKAQVVCLFPITPSRVSCSKPPPVLLCSQCPPGMQTVPFLSVLQAS